jgi:putative oxidoreductase
MDWVVTIVGGLLGLMFVFGGWGKITGSQLHVDNFKHWRLPQNFRVFTGLVELLGGLALLIGIWVESWSAAGALAIAITMFVGIFVHLRVQDSMKLTFPAVLILVIALIVFFAQLSDLSDFPN